MSTDVCQQTLLERVGWKKEIENVAVVECISNVQWTSFDAMFIEK